MFSTFLSIFLKIGLTLQHCPVLLVWILLPLFPFKVLDSWYFTCIQDSSGRAVFVILKHILFYEASLVICKNIVLSYLLPLSLPGALCIDKTYPSNSLKTILAKQNPLQWFGMNWNTRFTWHMIALAVMHETCFILQQFVDSQFLISVFSLQEKLER